jgi:hypothetical protein
MQPTLLISMLLLFSPALFSQQHYTSTISIDNNFKDSFSFPTQWEYPWYVIKDDYGHFENTLGKKITRKDTAHLFFTAQCETNVQGSHAIHYCYAEKKRNELLLIFEDGLPAYGSTFTVHIKNDSFYFSPRTIYPQFIPGGKKTYRIDKEKLVLNKDLFVKGELVKGYADIEFTEIINAPANVNRETKFYLRGYFRTPLK